MEHSSHKNMSSFIDRYLTGVLSGDVKLVNDVIDDCYRHTQSVFDIYFEVIATAQSQIGEMWHDGSISVAEEHLSTEIAINQMERLRNLLPLAEMNGFSVIVTTVEGEHHFVGARMIADLLHSVGWEVHYLGSQTPRDSLVKFAHEKIPNLILFSFTRQELLPELQRSIGSLQRFDSSLPVIVGGSGASLLADQIREIGADVITDPIALIIHARKIVGDSFDDYSLDRHLERIGDRIQRMRKNNDWSQQALAKHSGLDRTYISGVENGRQNLTMGALLKLTNAFGTSIDSIMSESIEDYF